MKRADGALNAGSGDEHMGTAKDDLHAVDGGGQLLEVADIGTNAEGSASGMFNLELGQVEFRGTSGKEADTGPRGGEADRQPLTNSPARTGNQYAFIF